MEDELKNLKANMGILNNFGMSNTPLHTENDEDTDVATPRPDASFKNERSESLLETAGLRLKLEHITDKINRIREGLHEKSEDSLLAEINEQLTSIQDSIEDAENDVENNIERTIGKLKSDNEKNRKRVKSLKRERKDKEEMERFTRQKEQEAIIERQRLQIEQLLQKQSSGHTLQTPMKSVGHRSTSSA